MSATDLFCSFEPVHGGHDEFHAFLGVEHELLPPGGDVLSHGVDQVAVVVVVLQHLLRLLGHL